MRRNTHPTPPPRHTHPKKDYDGDQLCAASWILDLAKNGIPEGSEIVGVDISTIMFPTEVHKNVSLYEMSSTDLPSSWDAYFDLVNQRFLIAALTKEQWKKIISKLFRALKPGGAIQILEVDHYKSSFESLTLAATEKCDGYCNAIIEKRNLLGFDCCQQLPILLEEAGFKDIHVEVQRMPLGKQWGKLGVMGSEDWAALYRAIGTACLQEGGLGVCESRTEIDSVVEQAMKEWDETPGVFVPVYAMTARKPL